MEKQTIVIDPGHGGHDLGEVDERGEMEKNFTLQAGKALAAIFQEMGHEVIMTRGEDIAVSLAKRVALANRKEADLFISLHRKSFLNLRSKGAVTYYYNHQQQKLADCIQDKMVKISSKERWETQMEKFYVLKYTDMPAILIEAISPQLTPDQLAKVIFAGVRTYWQEKQEES